MFAPHDYQELRRRLTRKVTGALLRETLRPQSAQSMSGAEIRRVLVCRPNHRLGNLLMLTPLLKELQHAFPAAMVDIVLAGEDGAALFRTFHNVGCIHTLSRRMIRHPLQTTRIAIQIRRAQYDLVIDPCEGSQSSRWLTAVAHATHVVSVSGDAPTADVGSGPNHMAKRPVYVLRQAIAASDADYPTLDIQPLPAERQRGQQILSVLTPAHTSFPRVIGIFADATGTKRYSEAWWLRCIEILRARFPDFTIMEITPPDGRSRLSSRFPHFFSPDIREVAAVISRMAYFMSADCGVMHLACASGTPTIGLFSVTEIAKYAPYGHGSCAIDTNGKSPEQVAQQAATMLQAIEVGGIAAIPARAMNPKPTEAMTNLAGDKQPIRSNIET